MSGVKVAPCLLPKISGVELTLSVMWVESSEQFWHKIRRIWRICEPCSLKKITLEVKFAEWKSTLLQNNNVWKKKFCLCSVLQANPAVASSNEQLYEQMMSNPAFTEKYTKTQRLSPRFLSGAKIFGHVSHSTQLVRVCLACQHFDFNSTESFSSADVGGAGTHDEPLRTSAWEASFGGKPPVFSKIFPASRFCLDNYRYLPVFETLPTQGKMTCFLCLTSLFLSLCCFSVVSQPFLPFWYPSMSLW